jgi:hypothetical protein
MIGHDVHTVISRRQRIRISNAKYTSLEPDWQTSLSLEKRKRSYVAVATTLCLSLNKRCLFSHIFPTFGPSACTDDRQSCILGSKAKNTIPPAPRYKQVEIVQCVSVSLAFSLSLSLSSAPLLSLFSLHNIPLCSLHLVSYSTSLPPMKVRRGSSGAGVFFPFSIGCMSQSSVAVADPQEKTKPQSDPSSSSSTTNTAQSKFLITAN